MEELEVSYLEKFRQAEIVKEKERESRVIKAKNAAVVAEGKVEYLQEKYNEWLNNPKRQSEANYRHYNQARIDLENAQRVLIEAKRGIREAEVDDDVLDEIVRSIN